MIWRISLLLFIALAGPVSALECRDVSVSGKSYSICDVDMSSDNLRLFQSNSQGDVYGSFQALPGTVLFAMNAGMFHRDRSPVGYYVERGLELSPLITSAGPGNFGMLPNGIFCFGPRSGRVIETRAFSRTNIQCDNATQSGPMLVIDGALHPRFIPTSDSTNIRNGVGVSDDRKTAYFVISNEPVNFYSFALVFRNFLSVNNALYLDGRISRLYAPQLNRNDFGIQLGPIVAVVD